MLAEAFLDFGDRKRLPRGLIGRSGPFLRGDFNLGVSGRPSARVRTFGRVGVDGFLALGRSPVRGERGGHPGGYYLSGGGSGSGFIGWGCLFQVRQKPNQ
eukprot:1014788-Amorphochlora_amoeboformis.AAC.1